jgi:hypothetical protein
VHSTSLQGHIPEESYLKNILFARFVSSPHQNMALSSNVARNIPRAQHKAGKSFSQNFTLTVHGK